MNASEFYRVLKFEGNMVGYLRLHWCLLCVFAMCIRSFKGKLYVQLVIGF